LAADTHLLYHGIDQDTAARVHNLCPMPLIIVTTHFLLQLQ